MLLRPAILVPVLAACGGAADDASLPPYGTPRLKAAFPLDRYTGDALVLLTALKRYGLLLADQDSAWFVTGTSDPRWESALEQLRAHPVRGSDFEVVAAGPMTTCCAASAPPAARSRARRPASRRRRPHSR